MKEQKSLLKIYKIDGVGVDLTRFHNCSQNEKKEMRVNLGFSETDFIITIVAELNKNKNQIMLIRNVKELISIIPNLKVLLIGKETLPIVRDYVIKEKLEKWVLFLGYRNDVEKLTMISDIAFSASIREGLPVNIIEAMACGIPVVCSDNRGHRSLIKNSEFGFIFNLKTGKEMLKSIIRLYENPELRLKFGKRSVEEAKKYDLNKAVYNMSIIYNEIINSESMRNK